MGGRIRDGASRAFSRPVRSAIVSPVSRPAKRAPARFAVALAVAVVGLGAVSFALAGRGSAAGYQPVFNDGGGGDAAASLYCSPGLIMLGLPDISAIPPTDSIYAPSQWVAWNVTIFYSADLVTWTEQTGAIPYWYFGQVNNRLSISDSVLWYSQQPTGLTTNMPFWTVRFVGYYAARMQIVWYLGDGTIATLAAQPPTYTLGVDGDWASRAPYCSMY
jgi:hypothetical protein